MNEEKKNEIWAHMLSLPKSSRGHGMTDRRVERLKPIVWHDRAFWIDVIMRHCLLKMTIEELKNTDTQTYAHCVSNFWGMLYQEALSAGVIKP